MSVFVGADIGGTFTAHCVIAFIAPGIISMKLEGAGM